MSANPAPLARSTFPVPARFARSAWIDAAANARTNGFFEKTLPGLDAGYLRSRLPGFTGYQEWAGELLVEVLRGSTTPDRAIDALDERWRGLNAGIR